MREWEASPEMMWVFHAALGSWGGVEYMRVLMEPVRHLVGVLVVVLLPLGGV